MNQNSFTSSQQVVLSALHKGHLTSSQILKKAESIPHILRLYSVLDELRAISTLSIVMLRKV